MQLITSVGSHDLWERGARAKSANSLVHLFYGLNKAVQPKIFIEAGAKAATTSIKIRELVPSAGIYAFETNPYNIEYYGQKFDHQKHDVKYLNLAITDKPGEITFKIRKAINGTPITQLTEHSSLLERNHKGTTYEKVTIEGLTLDSFITNLQDNCRWVDVEGATKQVLSGASELFYKTKVAMVEVEDREFWKGQWLSTKVIEFMYLHGLIPVARDFEYNGQYNIIFVNKETFTNTDIRRNLEYYHSVLLKK